MSIEPIGWVVDADKVRRELTLIRDVMKNWGEGVQSGKYKNSKDLLIQATSLIRQAEMNILTTQRFVK